MGDSTQPGTTSGTDSGLSGTVTVEGEPITVDLETTVADLRDMADITDPEQKATYVNDQDELQTLTETEPVLEQVPDGATISFQPIEGNLFG